MKLFISPRANSIHIITFSIRSCELSPNRCFTAGARGEFQLARLLEPDQCEWLDCFRVEARAGPEHDCGQLSGEYTARRLQLHYALEGDQSIEHEWTNSDPSGYTDAPALLDTARRFPAGRNRGAQYGRLQRAGGPVSKRQIGDGIYGGLQLGRRVSQRRSDSGSGCRQQ